MTRAAIIGKVNERFWLSVDGEHTKIFFSLCSVIVWYVLHPMHNNIISATEVKFIDFCLPVFLEVELGGSVSAMAEPQQIQDWVSVLYVTDHVWIWLKVVSQPMSIVNYTLNE